MLSSDNNTTGSRVKFMDHLELLVLKYYRNLFGDRNADSRQEDGLALAFLIALNTVFFTVTNWFIIDMLQFLRLEMIITILGFGSVLFGFIPVSAGIFMIYLRPTHWGWLYVASLIIGITFSWIMWGVWMAALLINTSQWLLEVLQYTPLFR